MKKKQRNTTTAGFSLTLIFRIDTVALAEQERKSIGQSFAQPALDADAAESFRAVRHGRDGSGGASGSTAASADPRSNAAEAHLAPVQHTATSTAASTAANRQRADGTVAVDEWRHCKDDRDQSAEIEAPEEHRGRPAEKARQPEHSAGRSAERFAQSDSRR